MAIFLVQQILKSALNQLDITTSIESYGFTIYILFIFNILK
jgi:hypothetical protein